MVKAYFECDDFESLFETLVELKEMDLLDGVSLESVKACSGRFQFPIRISIPTESFTKAKKNPFVKAIKLKYGKQIRDKIVSILNQALRPG